MASRAELVDVVGEEHIDTLDYGQALRMGSRRRTPSRCPMSASPETSVRSSRRECRLVRRCSSSGNSPATAPIAPPAKSPTNSAKPITQDVYLVS